MSLRYCPKCSRQTMTYFRYLLGGVGRQTHQCPNCKAVLRIGGRFRLPAVYAAAAALYFLVRAVSRRFFPNQELPFYVGIALILCLIALLAAASYFSATWRTDNQVASPVSGGRC